MLDADTVALAALVLLFSFLVTLAQGAFLSVDPVSLYSKQRAGNKRARMALRLLEDKTRVATALIFIDIVCDVIVTLLVGTALYSSFGFAGVAIGAVGISLLLAIGFTLIPMAIGVDGALPLALRLTVFVYVVDKTVGKLTRPLASLSEGAGAAFFESPETTESVDELRSYVSMQIEKGGLGGDIGSLMNGMLHASDLVASSVAVPIDKLDMVSSSATVREALRLLSESKHHRLVAFDGSRDDIVGFLTMRSLTPALSLEQYDSPVLPYISKPLSVSVSDTLYSVMNVMSESDKSAVLVKLGDEVKGIVTVDDVVGHLLHSSGTV